MAASRAARRTGAKRCSASCNSTRTRVHFLGKLPYGAYRRLLQVSKAHVYLTYPFVLSWSMLETMACGCALAASDTAPVPEVIRDGENGLLVDFFDGQAITRRVGEVLADAGNCGDIRKGAAQLVRNAGAETIPQDEATGSVATASMLAAQLAGEYHTATWRATQRRQSLVDM